MIRLYQGAGSGEISFIANAAESEWAKYKGAAVKLLRARKRHAAADVLDKLPLCLKHGTNCFNDEFVYLSAICDMDTYVSLAAEVEKHIRIAKYSEIACTVSEIGLFIRFIVAELNVKEEQTLVNTPHLNITAKQVEEALADAEQLLKTRSPSSAIDRVHTAFHGYLLEQCRKNSIVVEQNDSITVLFKNLRKTHLRLKNDIDKHEEIDKICKAMAVIIDCMNPIRNQHSRAHPNDIVLGDDESLLVINSIRTMLHYLNSKL